MLVAVYHALRLVQLTGIGQGLGRLADHPDQAVPKHLLVAALDPAGGLGLAGREEAKVHRRVGPAGLSNQRLVAGLPVVRVPGAPGKGDTLELGAIRAPQQILELVLDAFALLLGGHADVPTLTVPLLPGGGLHLVAVLLRVAQQVLLAQPFEGIAHGVDLVAAVHAVVQAGGHQLGGGGLVFLD